MHLLHVAPDSLCGRTDKLVSKRKKKKKRLESLLQGIKVH